MKLLSPRLRLFFPLIPLLLAAPLAFAADYYVSPTGNDSASGTSTSNPWRTISQVNSVNFLAGDRIYFQGGSTFGGNLYLDAADTGTSANRIVISSYGTGKATIDGGTGGGIFLYNTGGFVISNLIVKGSGIGSNIGTGIDIYTDLPGKRAGVRIDACEVFGFGGQISGTQLNKGQGIFVWGWRSDTQSAGHDNLEVLNCVVHSCENSGLVTWTHTLLGLSNVTVRGTTFHGNTGRAGLASPTGNGVVLGRVNTGLIEHCIAYNNGAANTNNAGPVGIWTYDSTNITIQFCEAYANKTAGGDGGGFDLDGGVTNSVIQYCYSHDNYGAGYLLACYSAAPQLANNTIRYNISENDGRRGSYGGIMLWGAGSSDKVETTNIYHNTVYVGSETPVVSGSPSALRFLGSNFTGVKIWNNLFVSNAGRRLINADGAMSTSVAQLQGNNYWAIGSFSLKWGGTTHTSFNAWTTAASTQERISTTLVGRNVNPLLNAPGGGGTVGNTALLSTDLIAYKFSATSPMRDAGIHLSNQFGVSPGLRDFYGTTLPQGLTTDIGAYEFPAGAPTGPTVRESDGSIHFGNDISAYDATQDGQGSLPTNATVSGDGNAVTLSGNIWKKFPVSYTVTANTRLQVTVDAADIGEILGITLDNDTAPTTGRRAFRFGGSDINSATHDAWSWKISPTYGAGSGPAVYVIPVGTYFTGSVSYLGLIGDDDANGSTQAVFSNVVLYEDNPSRIFSQSSLTAYGTGQDGEGGLATTGTVGTGGTSITLTGNAWKMHPLTYTVTANTKMEVTVSGSDTGEIVGISLDNDTNGTSGRRAFLFGGSSVTGTAHDAWSWKLTPGYVAGSAPVTYLIPVGTFFTGTVSNIGFIGDDDANASTNFSFSEIKLYEGL